MFAMFGLLRPPNRSQLNHGAGQRTSASAAAGGIGGGIGRPSSPAGGCSEVNTRLPTQEGLPERVVDGSPPADDVHPTDPRQSE